MFLAHFQIFYIGIVGTEIFFKRSHRIAPVSYTHLDVYKRQELLTPLHMMPKQMTTAVQNRTAEAISVMITVLTIGKTDVYKRQVFTI